MLSFAHEKCQQRERNSVYAKPLYKALYFGALAKTTQATKEMVILVTEFPVSQALDETIVTALVYMRWERKKMITLSK